MKINHIITEEDVKVPGPMRMNDYHDQADAIQEKLRQAIQTGNKQLIQQLSKQRDDLDAHVKTHGMMPEDITRRGFLQGAGAAAVAGAAGGVSAAEYESKEIGNWEFSVRNSKFDGKSVSPATTQYTPGGHDGNQGHNGGGKFRYDGKSLTYWSGSGGPVSKFDQIQPNTVVRYSIDNGPIKSTRSDNIGSVDFTKEIPALMNANKIEIAYTYLNNRSKNTGPAENSLLVNGFKEIYHIFKNEKVVKESVNQGVAEGRAGLPDPNNFDSDNDYYDARDAYAKPQDNDSDYENWAVDDANESKEKIGNMDADAFDAALARMKKLAGAGPLRTVYDPARRVYKNVPHAVQPAQQPKKAR